MIPYGHQKIDQNDIRAVVKTLKSAWLTQGPKVLEFEKALARYCGAKYAVAVSNGTAALHLAYLAAGLRPGDEAITTPNTFVATTNMLVALSVKPVFCDIRLDTYNIDESKIEKLITKRTKAIVPVHFAGQSATLAAISRIAKRHKLLVIEDACHALGARYKNSKIGDCRYSAMAIFSFHPVKSITTGEGGAILTNDKEYYKKLISWRNHGIHKDKTGKNIMTELGYNYRLTDIQAALGLSQLKKVDKFVKQRQLISGWYEKNLKDIKQILRPTRLEDGYSAWHIYVIRTREGKVRDRLAAYLKNNGIGVNFHYPAVYSHPFYRQLGYKNFKLENEEIFHESCLTLPCYPGLEEYKVKYICGQIKNFYIRKQIANYKRAPALVSDRIYLKILQTENATKEYCRWLNDPEVNKYLETRQISLKQLKDYIKKQLNDHNSLFYGIFDKKNNRHIGNAKLEPIDWEKKTSLFGIMIGNKNYWGKGIGTEVARLIKNHAFTELGLKEIKLGVITDNKSAIRVYEKVGFKINKIKKKSINHNGVLYDEIIMTTNN